MIWSLDRLLLQTSAEFSHETQLQEHYRYVECIVLLWNSKYKWAEHGVGRSSYVKSNIKKNFLIA